MNILFFFRSEGVCVVLDWILSSEASWSGMDRVYTVLDLKEQTDFGLRENGMQPLVR